jgi:hypothetical protein
MLYSYRAVVWAGVGISCTINICAADISQKVVSLQHPTAESAMKVNLAAQVLSHTVAASRSALVATGQDQCTVCYELYSVSSRTGFETIYNIIFSCLSHKLYVIIIFHICIC